MGNMIHIKQLESFEINDPDMSKTDLPKIFLYFVNNESEAEFSADVRDPDGQVIFAFGPEVFDGIMQHKDDLSGLKKHLTEKNKIGQNDDIAYGNKVALNPTGAFNQMTPEFNTNESNLVRIQSFQDFQDQSAKPSDLVPGGKASDLEPEDIADEHNVSLEYIMTQLDRGQKVEMEHTDDPSKAREIAKDHLWEMPDYYEKLATIEPENENESLYKSPQTGKEHSMRYENTDKDFAKYLRTNYYNVKLSNEDISIIRKNYLEDKE